MPYWWGDQPHTRRSLLGGMQTSIVLLPDTDQWTNIPPLVVYYFSLPRRTIAQGGGPFNMKTIACSTGLNLLALLGLTGNANTDSQGLTATLHHLQPLKQSGGKPCLPFLRACARALRQPNISLRWSAVTPNANRTSPSRTGPATDE